MMCEYCKNTGCSHCPPGINTKQPTAIPNTSPAIWDLVVADMIERDVMGAKKHGTRLQAGNGRDNLVDAYQEALDLCVYLRTEIYQRDNPTVNPQKEKLAAEVSARTGVTVPTNWNEA